MLTLDELKRIFPRSGASAAIYLEPLNATLDEFAIDNPDRQAAFLATIAVESRELTRTSENMHYLSATRIRDVFTSSFPTVQDAIPYIGHPEKLANRVYANRYGNGPESSGDGWRYRGAGLIQNTFRDNHAACAAHFKMPVETIGDWMRTPEGAARSSGWYWWSRALNVLADQGQFATLTRRVNRASAGMAERWEFLARARAVLA